MSSPRPSLRKFAVIAKAFLLVGACCVTVSSWGATSTNLFSGPAPSLPDTGPSLLRVLGALSLVLGLFLGGAWLVRKGRFGGFVRGGSAQLNVLESRSLGARQALYVVGYGQERFLIGSTPAGINLVSHLPQAPEGHPQNSGQAAAPSFSQALAQVLRGQKPMPGNKEGAK